MFKLINQLISYFKDLIESIFYDLNSFEEVKNFAPRDKGVYMFRHQGTVKYVGHAYEDMREQLESHWLRGPADIYNHRDELYVVLEVCHSEEEVRSLRKKLMDQHETHKYGWN